MKCFKAEAIFLKNSQMDWKFLYPTNFKSRKKKLFANSCHEQNEYIVCDIKWNPLVEQIKFSSLDFHLNTCRTRELRRTEEISFLLIDLSLSNQDILTCNLR